VRPYLLFVSPLPFYPVTPFILYQFPFSFFFIRIARHEYFFRESTMCSPFSRIISSIVLFAICCLLLAPTSLASVQDPVAEIVVSEGTPINVVTAQEITSKAAKPNDPVNFTVNEDLLINGQVVVRKGTPAIGSVINAEKGGYLGKSGKLGVQVESTQTVGWPAAEATRRERQGR
jgi:hypothetical protein